MFSSILDDHDECELEPVPVWDLACGSAEETWVPLRIAKIRFVGVCFTK